MPVWYCQINCWERRSCTWCIVAGYYWKYLSLNSSSMAVIVNMMPSVNNVTHWSSLLKSTPLIKCCEHQQSVLKITGTIGGWFWKVFQSSSTKFHLYIWDTGTHPPLQQPNDFNVRQLSCSLNDKINFPY